MICDPVVCPLLSCLSPVQVPDQCCPVCPGECHAGVGTVMGAPPAGDEASRKGSRGHPLPSLFFGFTEKQGVRDLPGLPRTRDPGEGELAVYEPGWGTKRRCWVGPNRRGDGRVRVYMGG